MSKAPIIALVVEDYSKNYGGVPVFIDGKECSFGSVVGYALYYSEDPVDAVLRAVEKRHPLVWINKRGAVLCGDPGYYDRERERVANYPRLALGDVVKFEGKVYEIVAAPNKNYGLKEA